MLCENPLKSDDIRLFLLTKTSERTWEKENEEEREGTLPRNKLHYYTLYSNGLIYQFYSVRALLWKVSIGYLPPAKNKWVSVMEGSLIYYHDCLC